MASKPSKRDLLTRVREESKTNTGRRRVVQSGIVGGIAGLFGLGPTTASARSVDEEGIVSPQARPTKLEEVTPLLNRLSDEGLLDSPSPAALDHESLANSDRGSAVVAYEDRVVHTFVTRVGEEGKLTVNVPEVGDAHAIYSLTGDGPGRRVRFEQIGNTVETTEMVYSVDESASTDPGGGGDGGCGQYCGGSTCSPAGNCWDIVGADNRYCVEDCKYDSSGNQYCHDDCSCGCP